MNFPTVLTFIRILCVPILVVLLVVDFNRFQLLSFAIFLFAALTDSLDGYLARKKSQVTVLGQLLDPIADKLLIASVFICLVELGLVEAWIVVIIIAREIAVTGFRGVASSKGIHIPAYVLGKIKMNAEAYTIALLLLGERYMGGFFFLTRVGLYLIIVTAVLSAMQYFVKFGPRILKADPA